MLPHVTRASHGDLVSMSNRPPDIGNSQPGILAKGIGAIVLAVVVALIVMILGGILGVILQIMFAPVLGAEAARIFAFIGPVIIVSAWVYAKYYTKKGNGRPKDRPIALGGLAVFAILMAAWFINEPPPSVQDPRKDAEELAKPCTGNGIRRLACELNKDTIKRRQDSGR
jgi:hypothetical protein